MTDIIETPGAVELVELAQPPAKRTLRERGMATVEYAVGLLAAAAVALVLLRIFMDNEFFQFLFRWVVDMIKNLPLP